MQITLSKSLISAATLSLIGAILLFRPKKKAKKVTFNPTTAVLAFDLTKATESINQKHPELFILGKSIKKQSQKSPFDKRSHFIV